VAEWNCDSPPPEFFWGARLDTVKVGRALFFSRERGCCDGRKMMEMEMDTDAVARGRWVIIGVAKGTSFVEMGGSALGRQWREWPLVLVRQAYCS